MTTTLIVSPSFMNQRKLPDDMVILPVKSRATKKAAEDGKPEDLIFDKADEAEAKERTEIELLEQLAQIEFALKTAEGEAKTRKQNELAAIQEAVKQLKSAKSPSDKT
jgi:small conductance mechanosensitive channel